MIEVISNAYTGYFNYLIHEITHPHWGNYFYWLVGLSIITFLLELAFPWRTNQAPFRKDFWQDLFYVFFNYFLFSLMVYNALSAVGVELFNEFLQTIGLKNIVAIKIQSWPVWGQLLTLFIIADFIQWLIHRMLHANDFLWRIHQIHHSVTEMGFAAHLRFHFLETIIYKSILFVPLSMIGFGIVDFFWVHTITLFIGHLNHANIPLSYGPLKYLINNPVMHIWHHAKNLPSDRQKGVNFGISLSIWDYLFGTVYMPHDGKNEALGFESIEQFPESFIEQVKYPFKG
jgi:sterol desaturase/sphingolipid hydroxylase (fatty acid hydroxylase superfamily)